jgi:hypothetical protein
MFMQTPATVTFPLDDATRMKVNAALKHFKLNGVAGKRVALVCAHKSNSDDKICILHMIRPD